MITTAFFARLDTVDYDVFPQVIPQNSEAPAITYRLDSDLAPTEFGGARGLREALFSVDCWSEDHVQAHTIAADIEALFDNFSGDLGGISPAVTADHVRVERKFDSFERPTGLYRVSLQFFIAYY